jgi:hypothetical protein
MILSFYLHYTFAGFAGGQNMSVHQNRKSVRGFSYALVHPMDIFCFDASFVLFIVVEALWIRMALRSDQAKIATYPAIGQIPTILTGYPVDLPSVRHAVWMIVETQVGVLSAALRTIR